MTTKVFNENGTISGLYIPVLWWDDEGMFRFGRLFDLEIFDFGTKEKHSRFISVTILGLTISIRIKKG